MPQLDTVYIFTTFLWTWFTIHLMTQKIKTIVVTKVPKMQQHAQNQKLTPTMPWT